MLNIYYVSNNAGKMNTEACGMQLSTEGHSKTVTDIKMKLQLLPAVPATPL